MSVFDLGHEICVGLVDGKPQKGELMRLIDLTRPKAGEKRIVKKPLFDGASSRGALLCLEPGQGVPPHSHHGFEVTLQALEGPVTLLQEDAPDIVLNPGQLCFADGSASFAPRNDSDQPVRVLVHLIRKTASARL